MNFLFEWALTLSLKDFLDVLEDDVLDIGDRINFGLSEMVH